MNSPPVSLLIDTTIDGVTMGLCEQQTGRLLHWKNLSSSHHNSSSLNTLLQEMLTAEGCEIADITQIVVGQGPGSFTGIKVGLAFAYGLRHSPNVARTVGYCPLGELCASDRENRWWILGATRDRGALAYKNEAGEIELADITLTESLTWPSRGVILVKQWTNCEELMKKRRVPWACLPTTEINQRSMEIAARVSADQYNDHLGNSLPAPVYLRKSTAEEKLDAKQTEDYREGV